MYKKKTICITLVIVLLLSFSSTFQANAQEIGHKEEEITSIQYEHTSSTGAVLGFVDGKAVLTGSVSGYPDRTTKINGFLYLQHKINSKWITINGWSDSVQDWSLDIMGDAPGLPSGTYRARFVTYVYEGDEFEEVIFLGKEVVYKKDE